MSKKKKLRPEPESLNMPLVGVETHAHLDLNDFSEDLECILEKARVSGVARIGNVFLGTDAYERNKGLFADHPEVFFILGAHPNDAEKYPDPATEVDRMRNAFANSRLKAVGEIGLDFYWDRAAPDRQEALFRAQLDLARELEKPVVIHSRDAEKRTLEVLDSENWANRPLLWHCFGGGPELAHKILERGWHISVPGPVTYSKNTDLREAVAEIPLDRLVLETDCPYLTPEPWRGKRNHPALMAFTAARIAEIKGIDPARLWESCSEVALKFFSLGPLEAH